MRIQLHGRRGLRHSSSSSHKRSLTMAKGHTVSVVLISSALETIAASKEAKRSAPLRESVQRALEMVKSGQGGDKPREIFEPLRLACETRNEKLMIASLDCISKLISYSFFAESSSSSHAPSSPPPSPGPNSRHSTSSQAPPPPPSLVDLVVHTITSCHTESTPETVSLQIVKALLALVLSPTILVHQSSLLKAVRTVYNVFLLSVDPVNQMVAQGVSLRWLTTSSHGARSALSLSRIPPRLCLGAMEIALGRPSGPPLYCPREARCLFPHKVPRRTVPASRVLR